MKFLVSLTLSVNFQIFKRILQILWNIMLKNNYKYYPIISSTNILFSTSSTTSSVHIVVEANKIIIIHMEKVFIVQFFIVKNFICSLKHFIEFHWNSFFYIKKDTWQWKKNQNFDFVKSSTHIFFLTCYRYCPISSLYYSIHSFNFPLLNFVCVFYNNTINNKINDITLFVFVIVKNKFSGHLKITSSLRAMSSKTLSWHKLTVSKVRE